MAGTRFDGAIPHACQPTGRGVGNTSSGSLRRTAVQEPANAVVTRAYGFSFVLPCLFYTFYSSFQITLDHFTQRYYPATIMSSLVTKWKKTTRTSMGCARPASRARHGLSSRSLWAPARACWSSCVPRPLLPLSQGTPLLYGPCRPGSLGLRPCSLPWHKIWDASI